MRLPLPTSLQTLLLASALVSGAAAAGCRGQESESSPVHLNPNMDSQPRYDPQSEAKFYEDRRSMRHPVDGTVAQGNFHENEGYARGREGDKYVLKVPVPITEAMLKRGQQRYDIFCVPCHDKTGSGNGMVARRAKQIGDTYLPSNLHSDTIRGMSDGQLFVTISEGVRTMPAYGAQVSIDDRWAIVAYVRALQFSQSATLDDVPADKRGGLPVEAQPQEKAK